MTRLSGQKFCRSLEPGGKKEGHPGVWAHSNQPSRQAGAQRKGCICIPGCKHTTNTQQTHSHTQMHCLRSLFYQGYISTLLFLFTGSYFTQQCHKQGMRGTGRECDFPKAMINKIHLRGAQRQAQMRLPVGLQQGHTCQDRSGIVSLVSR